MPQPPPYQRQANFKNNQALNPTGQPDGTLMDGEFNAIKATLDAIEGRLPLIQRDDGNIANGSITSDQLSFSLSTGFTLRGTWAAGVQYNTGDGVISGLKFFRALVANLSTSLNSPVADPIVTWQQVADLAAIGLTIVHSAEAATDGTVNAPGIGFGSQVLGFFKQAANVMGLSVAGVQSFLFSGAGVSLPADPTLALHAATKQYVDAQILAAVAPAIAAATQGDIGVVKWFPATTLPTNHVLCYGQALSRSLPLFNVFGTTYGAGDGSSTFNNIDMRGIVPAGVDNMGGVAAGRLTSESISGGATTVGNSGGEETHLLLAAELAAHTHAITDPGHVHSITDPQHSHPVNIPISQIGTAGGGGNAAAPATGSATAGSLTHITINSGTTGITVSPTAAGSGHNNVQPTRVGNWIVRTG